MSIHKKIGSWLLLILVLLLSACTLTTSTIMKDPKYASNASDAVTLYFIRPVPTRTRGISDGNLKIELNDDLVAKLSLGEYVAMKVKPGRKRITVRSLTYLTSNPTPVKVHRFLEFDMEPCKTYLVLTKFDQEGFRGMYFKPVIISVADAKKLLKRLTPHGKLATQHPIESL